MQSCMKALKWLEVNQVVFDERPIKEENPSYEELKAWYEMSGLPLKKNSLMPAGYCTNK